MAESSVTTGELRLSDRGFREDIELAMGSDVRRAIIELVTNSDDSYVRKGQSDGEIVVEVEHRTSQPKLIRVVDEAQGMTRDDIDQKLAVAGNETSGFDEGSQVRGFFGRGGRDVVHFGPVTWTTWKSGEHHEFSLEHHTAATRRYEIRQLQQRPPRASGTIVTLEVQQRFRVPRHTTLLEDLSRHLALRPILTGRGRSKIFLRDRGKPRSEELRYPTPDGQQLEHLEVDFERYKGTARLELFESPESLSDGKERPYWRHSLLITSGGAAYDVFPGGRFASEPYASALAHLHGSIDVPQLAELMRQFDARERIGLVPDELNPIRLVRRDRTGLSKDHPFVQDLFARIEEVLDRHIQRLLEKARSERAGRVSEENRRRFGDVSKMLSEYLEEEDLPVDGPGGGRNVSDAAGLSIIPSSQVLSPGESGALTLRYQEPKAGAAAIDAPTVYVQVALRRGGSYKFSEVLKQRKGYYSKGVRIRAEPEDEVAQIHARYRSYPAEGTIRWKQREQAPIDSLQWNRKSYTLTGDKIRRALLYAPWQLVSEDDEWQLGVSPQGSVAVIEQSQFQYDYELDAGVAVVEITPVEDETPGKMVAEIGGQIATAELRLAKPRPGGLHIDLVVSEIQRRAWYEEDSGVLRVNAGHPAIKRVLGSKEDGWPGQDSVAFQAMLSELLAATMVRHSLSRTFESSHDTDVNSLFATYDTKVSVLAGRLQRALISDADLRAANSFGS